MSLPSRRRHVGALAAAAVLSSGLLATLPSTGSAVATSETFAPKLVLVQTPTRADKERLQTLGLDLTEHAGRGYVEVVLHNALDQQAVEDAGFEYDVRIPDLVARSLEIAELNERYAASVDTSPLPSGRDTYRTLADYNADMAKLAKDYPSLVKRFALKRPTLDGRTVYGVEIGKDVRKPNSGQPTFLLMGLHHAREWPSGELSMEFAIDLAKNYGRDERITRLLGKARVVVVPVVNPDGFELSRTDGELVDLRELNDDDPLGGSTSILATPGQAYKRKNCRVVDGQDTPDGTCRATANSNGGYGIGVDLNRNYGGFWGGPGASTTFADPTYRGASAFSEPEIANIKDIVTSRQVTMVISNHTFSNLVLRPNGVNPATIGQDGLPVGDAPDEAALKRLGAKMATQNGYANIHGWQLYDTTGTTEDYTYNATGGFGYTFEIGEQEFHPPFEQVVGEYVGTGAQAGKGNREAYLVALEHAVDRRYSGLLTGRAPAGATIRLKKTFASPTWEGSFKDGIDTAVKLGRDGRLQWLVNPSTRPVVQSRIYRELADRPARTETIEGTTPAPNASRDTDYTLAARTDLWRVELDWATPDDMDLEVFKKNRDGSLTSVGTSGNLPGQKEIVEVPNADAGDYLIRVVNYASASPTFTITSSLFDAVVKRTPGKREAYTLTCEKDGKVLQTERVFIGRGDTRRIDLAECRRKA